MIDRNALIEQYHRAGWNLVPVRYRSKQPAIPRWTELRTSQKEIEQVLKLLQTRNVGLLLGDENGFVDIDIDYQPFRRLTFFTTFFPETELIWGREKLDGIEPSHCLVCCHGYRKKVFVDQQTKATIFEFRGTDAYGKAGFQTVIPPSQHENGEFVQWYWDVATFTPPELTAEELEKRFFLIALTYVVSKVYLPGSRNQIVLGFAGLLRKRGVDLETAKKVVHFLCELSGDNEIQNRLGAVEHTYKKQLNEVAGYSLLSAYLSREDLTALQELFSYREEPAQLRETTPAIAIRQILTDKIKNSLVYVQNHGWARVYNKRLELMSGDQLSDTSTVKHYVLHKLLELKEEITELIGDKHCYQFYRKIEYSTTFIDSLIKDLTALDYLGVTVEETATVQGYLNLQDCLLHVSADGFSVFDPQRYYFKYIDFTRQEVQQVIDALNSNQSIAQFLTEDAKSLLSLFAEDEQEAQYIQMIFGMALFFGHEQKFVVLSGEGATGKTTLMNILQYVFSKYAVTLKADTFRAIATRNLERDLLPLVGARLARINELPGSTLDIDLIKNLSGGENIQARRLYHNAFEFKPQALLVFVTNNIPNFGIVDYAVTRRLIPIHLTKPITNPDPMFERRFLMKRENILSVLAWLLEGAYRYAQNPAAIVELPKSSEQVLTNIRRSLDPVTEFVNEYIVPDPDEYIEHKELEPLFLQFVVNENYMSESAAKRKNIYNKLKKALLQRGYSVERNSATGRYGFKGVRVTYQPPTPDYLAFNDDDIEDEELPF